VVFSQAYFPFNPPLGVLFPRSQPPADVAPVELPRFVRPIHDVGRKGRPRSGAGDARERHPA
jgi:hypothetical protein